MKIPHKHAFLFGLLSMSAGAYAQSSVSLYGSVDNSLQYVHNTEGKSNKLSLQSGNFMPSLWGLKGTEDLGGGLTAQFALENGFDINNGVSSSGMWGRKAYVGLSGNDWGTVTLGRQTDILLDLLINVQGDYFMEYFTAPGDVDLADGSINVQNAVKWTSPSWNGFQAGAMYAFGNIAGATGSGQSYAAAANYIRGPLTLAAGYLHSDNGNARVSTRGTGSATGLFYSDVNSAYATASAFNIARAGAAYAIGPVTLGGYYSYSEYLADGYSSFGQAERFNNVSLWAFWQVTTAASLEAGYNLLKSHGDSAATYHQATLAADYFLSKRTDVYVSVSYGHASGQNGAGPAKAVIADSYASGGAGTQELVLLGVRHKF